MDFERIFDAVDTNNDGVINRADLITYARSRNLDEDTFSQKWLNLFDHDHDGIIHENDFRSKLGMNLRPEREIQHRVAPVLAVQRPPEHLPIVLRSDMNPTLQHEIIAMVMSHSGYNHEHNISLWKLEDDLNRKYQRQWHALLNPAAKDISRTKYAHDGMLLLRLPERNSEVFIWRSDPNAKKKCCPFCCC